jgi:hypothetical protein
LLLLWNVTPAWVLVVLSPSVLHPIEPSFSARAGDRSVLDAKPVYAGGSQIELADGAAEAPIHFDSL